MPHAHTLRKSYQRLIVKIKLCTKQEVAHTDSPPCSTEAASLETKKERLHQAHEGFLFVWIQ